MRLLQLIPLYDSYSIFLRELAEELHADGHDVLTLCRMGEGNLLPHKDSRAACQHFPLPRGGHPVQQYKAGKALAEVIEGFSPDVVHAHFSAAMLTAALGRKWCNGSTRWYGTFQGLQFPFIGGLRGFAFRKAEAFAASQMDEAWVLTNDDMESLQEAAPRANIRIQDSPGFGCADRYLDTPLPDESERVARRAEAGFSPENTVFIFIGRLVSFKGFHIAARAFMEAHRQRPDIRWLVLGEPDALHPSGLSDAEFEAFRTHEAVRWLHLKEDVLPWLDISDALLFPTTREGMPVGVMESLARRCPVLTNPVRGCRELIEEGVNGRFFKDNSVDSVQRTIETFHPCRAPEPPQRLRRSNWIREMRLAYGI